MNKHRNLLNTVQIELPKKNVSISTSTLGLQEKSIFLLFLEPLLCRIKMTTQ